MGRRWSLVLAGGDGVRLRPLTTLIAGDVRPKQFCRLFGADTLLDETRRRVGLVVDAERTLFLVTGVHRPFWAPLLAAEPIERLVVQPLNRGTAPAILYGLLRAAEVDPTGAVVLVPSDHWVSDDARFMAHVRAAFDAVDARADLVVLLGIAPDTAETDYGWIEPSAPLADVQPLLRVRRFVEKPAREQAEGLLAGGGLWNSLVLVARIPALLGLLRRAVPELVRAFLAIAPALGTAAEPAAIGRLYAGLPSTGFSEAVLARCPANLAVLPVRGVEWTDLGHPRRVMLTLARRRLQPAWMPRLAASC